MQKCTNRTCFFGTTKLRSRFRSYALGIALLLLGCNALAVDIKIGDPKEAIQMESLPIGYTGWVLNRDTGMLHECQLVNRWRDNDGNLWIRAKKINNNFRVEMGEDKTEIIVSRRSESDGKEVDGDFQVGSFSVGLGSGFVAAAQYLFIQDSGLLEKINSGLSEIKKIQEKMLVENKLIDTARINFVNSSLQVQFIAEAHSNLAQDITDKLDLNSTKINVTSPSGLRDIELEQYKWISSDAEFIQKANAIRSVLISHAPKDNIEASYYAISKESLLFADKQSFFGHKTESDFLLNVAKTAADVLVGFDPFTGTARSIYETLLGKNLITGEPLSTTERIIAATGIFAGGYALKAHRIFRVLRPIASKLGRATFETYRAIAKFLTKSGHGYELIGSGSVIRKINFRGLKEPKWGLNAYHLKEHFFGSGPNSLEVLDPKGNPDKWMNELMDVIQRPVNKVTRNGKLDILHYYPKADGTGYYRLGVRLSENEDKTFDLVTILTRQK